MSQHKFTVDGIEIACEVVGSGAPLVLIHGFPFDHSMWGEQIDVLSQSCRVIAPDLRGYGDSASGSQDSATGVTMQHYAREIVAVLDALEVSEPCILCGFSMGGYILWQLAQLIPERIRAIIPCDTRALADTEVARKGRIKMAESVEQTGTDPVAEAMLPKLLAQETLENRQEIVDSVTQMILQAPPASVAASQRGMAVRPNVTNVLGSFDFPALVLVGNEDAISPTDEMRSLAESLPRATFVEIPGAGHMSPLENPAAFNAAIQEFIEAL